MSVRFRTVLGLLFLHPKFGVTIAGLKRCWIRLSLLIVVSSLVFCVFKSWSQAPYHAKDIALATHFVATNLDGFTLKPDGFAWNGTLDEPQHTYLKHMRFDIAETRSDIKLRKLKDDIMGYGIILDRFGLHFWHKQPSAPDGLVMEPMSDPRLLQNLYQTCNTYGFTQLTLENESKVKAFLSLVIFTMTAFNLLCEILVSVGMTVLVFTAVTFITRWTLPFSNLWSGLSTSLALCIPPILASFIYIAFGLSNDFESMFSIMLIVYIAFYMIEGRNQGLMAVPHNRPPQQ